MLYPLRLWNWKLSLIFGRVCLGSSLALFLFVVVSAALRSSDDSMGAVWGPIYTRMWIGFLLSQTAVATVVGLVQSRRLGVKFGPGLVSGFCDALVLLALALPLVPFASGFTSFAGDLGLLLGWLGGQSTLVALKAVD